MAHRILLTRDIKAQLKNLPSHIKAVARKRIAGLAIDPRPPRSKELAGHPGHYRLHLGARHRLVWEVRDEEEIIEIEYVGPKAPELYAQLGLARPSAEEPKADREDN